MKWLRVGLEIIGAASLPAVVAFAGWILHSRSSDKINRATRKDVQFALNWGGISTNQDYRVISSYESSRSFTGDHLDYFCIELPKFEVAEWAKNEWQDGPEKDSLLAEALKLATDDAIQHGGSCIPSVEKANSSSMKLMFPHVVLHNRQASAADIVLYDPQKRMLYYVSYKT
jgi:hypothetical protein